MGVLKHINKKKHTSILNDSDAMSRHSTSALSLADEETLIEECDIEEAVDEFYDADDIFKSMVEHGANKKYNLPTGIDLSTIDSTNQPYAPFVDCLPLDID